MLTLLLGLGVASGYGISNFLGGVASRRAPLRVVAFGSQAIAVILLVALLPLIPGHMSTRDLAFGIGAGVFTVAGILFFYAALSRGQMGLLSPLNGAVAAAIQILFGVLLGEQLSLLALAGIVFAVVAIFLVAPNNPKGQSTGDKSTLPVLLAIASAVGFAGGFICLSRTSEDAAIWPLLIQRITLLCILGPLTIPTMIKRSSSWRSQLGLLALLGGSAVGADLCFLVLSRGDGLSIAAPLVSMAPVVVVLLARYRLDERWTSRQAVGLALSLTAAITIALA